MSAQSDKKQTTLSSLKKMKEQGEKFTCLTSYESTLTSKICDAGVDVVLVGDSLGMVIQGHDSTLPVTMDQLVYHLECVVKGNKGAHIMADMPFMSYATDDMGLENAKRLMQAGANSIKIEGGEWISKMASMLANRGIPVDENEAEKVFLATEPSCLRRILTRVCKKTEKFKKRLTGFLAPQKPANRVLEIISKIKKIKRHILSTIFSFENRFVLNVYFQCF